MFDDDFGGGGGFSNYQPAPVYYAPPEPTYYEPTYNPPEPRYEPPELFNEPHDDPLAYVPPVAGQGVIFDPTSAGAGHGFAALALADAEATRIANDELNAQIAQNQQAIPTFEDTPARRAAPRYSDAPTPAYTSASYATKAETSVETEEQQRQSSSARMSAARSERVAKTGKLFTLAANYRESPEAIVDFVRGHFNYSGIETKNGWYDITRAEVLLMRPADFNGYVKHLVKYLRVRRQLSPTEVYTDPRQSWLIAKEAFAERICADFGYVGVRSDYELFILPTHEELALFTEDDRSRFKVAHDAFMRIPGF